MNELQTASEKRIMQNAKIVGMTTTGCAMHQELVRCLAPKVVLIEEAGEVLEAHLLSCLTSATQHVIQIGDHMQLRPLVNEFPLSFHSNRGHDLDISMFERLVGTTNSTFALKVWIIHNDYVGKLVTLDTQRRMSPDICDLIRYTLYPSLEDGPNVLNYPSIKGFEHSLWFFDHNFRECGDDVSHQNHEEAQLTVDLAHHALLNGTGDIVILTPYLGQLKLLRGRLEAKHVRLVLEEKDIEALRELDSDEEENLEPEFEPSVDSRTLKQCLRLSTVDNFQGNEADFVLISTVRSNEQGSTGFLKVFNRVNVMLSRARHGMVILGSSSTLRQCRRAEMFQSVLDILEDKELIGNYINLKCQRHGTISQITNSKDVQTYVPYGGCQLPCNVRLSCGHVCAKLCHPDDARHKTNVCLEPCMRDIAACGHLCTLKCCDTCKCMEILPIYRLVCGHQVVNIRCSETHDKLNKIPCKTKVLVQIPLCKHQVEVKCQDAIELATARRTMNTNKLNEFSQKCTVVCNQLLSCGHPCASPCSSCFGKPGHFGVCKHPCERTLPCGHSCRAFCHPADQCPPCDRLCATECAHSSCPGLCKAPCNSCSEPCTWSCSHSKTTCPLPCGSPCIRLPCDERCEKTLSCGHQCPGLCGEICLGPKYCSSCGDENVLSQVVDLIMHTTLRDHDPNESPLVMWPCGHCFTIESMDGYLNLSDYFIQNRLTGQWADFRPLTLQDMESQRKSCPLCRFPLFKVHRYSRILNFHSLYENELKYLKEAIAIVEESKNKRTAFQESMALRRLDKWQRDMLKQSTAPAPSLEMATKERHYFEKAKMDDLNLHRYRNKMQSKAQTMLLMEALEVSLLVVRSMSDKLPESDKPEAKRMRLTEKISEAEVLAANGLELCISLSSWRSAIDFKLLHMKLLLLVLQGGHYDLQTKELHSKLKVALNDIRNMKMCTQELSSQAQEIYDKAVKMGKLTKAEKDAIFQAFAGGYGQVNDGFGGFGGHWYQCPNGHPYVITECGGAMQTYHCFECGAEIGGSDHRLLSSNQSAQTYFQS
ncbi:NF-X1 finger and helicase domain protein [Thraustotheca clavata]|uniref:NF-X1 finger and helicase domain protein n=1 Tax=Thraustotheca clavata TaxID=74557 RepID=A0A1V9YUQ8_9STRA|nr:NF-X1 finger and helicase domain protein [Thraustotheca clavata]